MADDPAMLRLAVQAQDRYIAEQVAALRELREYCAQEADRKPYDRGSTLRGKAYADVRNRLDTILSNVTGVDESL